LTRFDALAWLIVVQLPVGWFADSQDDSQHGGRLRMTSDAHGFCKLAIELWWTLMDSGGH
jgi:hypothetical protein